jgi:hypothetical protein
MLSSWRMYEVHPALSFKTGCYNDLVQAFTGNFQGTYVRPGNSWDPRSCRQQPGESLRDYIRRFSKQRTELPIVTDSDVIGAFLAGTTCRDLVSKLGRKTPTRASELMDIAIKFASGQEAVEAIFWKDKQPQGRCNALNLGVEFFLLFSHQIQALLFSFLVLSLNLDLFQS